MGCRMGIPFSFLRYKECEGKSRLKSRLILVLMHYSLTLQ